MSSAPRRSVSFRARLQALVDRRQKDADLDEEIRFHLSEDAGDFEATGVDATEAMREARKAFGNADGIREDTRETWGWASIDRLVQDVRYGVRLLGRHSVLTVVAVLSLALAIGANSAVFALVEAVLVRPLGFPEPNRLMLVWEASVASPTMRNDVAPANYVDWKTHNRVFEYVAAFSSFGVNLSGTGEPERLNAQSVSPEFFSVVGIQPVLGRAFAPDDVQGSASSVAIISHGLWQRQLEGRIDAPGRDLLLDGNRVSIVGVMPAGFQMMAPDVDVWVPAIPSATDRGSHYLKVIGRLKPNVSREQAQADVDAITQNIAREFPRDAENLRAFVQPLREHLVGQVRTTLGVLFAAVCAVLLIACANVANLLMARGAARSAEIALRSALGATRLRIVRQLLTESLLLAGLGGLAGLALAPLTFAMLEQLVPVSILAGAPVGLSLPVLAYALLVSLLTGIGFGILPAMQVTRQSAFDVLRRTGGRSAVATRRGTMRSALVVAEIALSVIVVIAAALLMQTFARLRSVEPGFGPDRVLTMNVRLPQATHADLERRSAFYAQVLERLEAMPGVAGAAFTTAAPLTWKGGSNGLSIDGRSPQPGQSALHRQVSTDYFRTMGIPLRAGRTLTTGDSGATSPVAVVNETMAGQFWPGEDAIGKRFKIGSMESPNPWVTIVGVAGDVKNVGIDAPARAEMYLPYEQMSYNASFAPAALVVRATGDPATLVARIRQAVLDVDPNQPVSNVATMEDVVAGETSMRRVGTWLMGAFAGLSLLLASIGLYGVLSYTVSQRLPEIGLRMALGAQSTNVLTLILGSGMKLALLGCVIGVTSALVLTRWMRNMLFEVSPTDASTFLAVTTLLFVVALAACYLPARRAMKTNIAGLLR